MEEFEEMKEAISDQSMETKTVKSEVESDVVGTNNSPPARTMTFARAEIDYGKEIRHWLYRNNPLYLLSVLFMFTGLFLAIKASETSATISTIVAFYVVQNIYEILLLAMALYLLKTEVNRRHGKTLLLFILLFLGDVTFFQVRITAMASTLQVKWVSLLVSTIYLVLTTGKICIVIYFLKIRVHLDRIFYFLSALALIYFSPHVLYYLTEQRGSAEAGYEAIFTGWWEIYLFWLVAALIQIPVIVSNWWISKIEDYVDNSLFGNEREFYTMLLLFPFVLLPIQFLLNIHPDAQAANPQFNAYFYCMIPYLIAGIFFVQSHFRSAIEVTYTNVFYDCATLFILLFIALITAVKRSKFGPVAMTPGDINLILLWLANFVTGVTRQNSFNLLMSIAMMGIASWNWLTIGLEKIASVTSRLSYFVWAIILIGVSFFTLVGGFFYSLRGGGKKEKLHI